MKLKKIAIFLCCIIVIIYIFSNFLNFSNKEKKVILNNYNVKSATLEEISEDSLYYLKNQISLGYLETNILSKNNNIKKEKIVLSESQGLAMEIFSYLNEKYFFEKSYSFLKRNMKLSNGLFSWKLDGNKLNKTNATIDDLRIYRALIRGNILWEINYNDIKKMEKSLKSLTKEGYFIDFLKSNEFSTYYIDGEALNILAERDPFFIKIKENTIFLIDKAKFSEGLPFYRDTYLIKNKKFKDQNYVKILQSLIVVYNKKILGMDIKSEYEQLKNIFFKENKLYSEYNLDGSIKTRVESIAIYGYLKLIAKMQNDDEFILVINEKIKNLLFINLNFQNKVLPISYIDKENQQIYSFDLLIFILSSIKIN